MKKAFLIILHFAFVLALYALAAFNVFASIPNRDTYDLVMGVLLFNIANRHQKMVDEEVDGLDESEDEENAN